MDKKLKILQLEDLASDAILIGKALKKEKLNFETLVVDSKDKFLLALKEYSPDIILADHSLPSFNSHEALELMAEMEIKIPFILITAAMSDEFAIDIIKKGADDYILKDRLNRLPNAIENVLEKYRFQNERQTYLDALVKNEIRFRTLIENSADGVVILNKGYKSIYASKACQRILGYPEDKISQMSVFNIVHPDDSGKVRQTLDKCQQNPGFQVSGLEARVKHSDGRWIWQEATLTNMLYNPAINGIIINFKNITERKIAESKLKESEEKYRSFFENSLDGILLTVTDGDILAANPAACAMFQMTEEEICKAGRFGIVDTTDPRLMLSIEERKRTGKSKAEINFIRKDGSKFPCEITASVFSDAIGNARTSMVIRDITERKLVEEQLRESEIFNKGVLASLTSHIAVIDATGTILAVNKAWDDFAKENAQGNGDIPIKSAYTGSNYFEVCHKAIADGDTLAAQALAGIQSVMNKEMPTFKLEYPCHSQHEQRWYIMRVMNFGADSSKVVISHLNITDRKVAEQKIMYTSMALEQALSEVKSIMDSSLDVISTIDDEGRFVTISLAAERIWGYKSDELIGRKYIDLVFAEDVANTIVVANQIKSGVPVTMFENRFVHKDGSIVPLLWSAKWDENDKLMYCIAKDATEKKRLEKAFENERERFHELFLHAPCSVGIFKGPEHVFEMANDHYLCLTGRKNIIGKTVREVFPEVESQGLFELLDNVYRTGNSFIANEHHIRVNKDGSGNLQDFYLNFAYQAYRNKENKIEGVFFFAIDVTEQVQARKQIENSEKQYRQIVETAQEGIWLIDKDNKTIFINNKLCQILGYDKDEILGEEIFSFMDEEGKQIAAQSLENKRKGISGQAEFKYISKTSKEVWASVSANPIFNEEGQYQGSLAMVADITEKKDLEKLLEKATQLARIGTYEVDLENNTLYWSSITKEIHEVPHDFIPATEGTINFYKAGASRDAIKGAIEQCIKNNTPFDLELQIVTAKAKERWVRAIGEAETKNEKCIRIYGSLQDIDKIKRAELELLKVYEEKNVILESIGDAFFAIDTNWVVTYWNKEAERLLGIPKQVIINKNLKDVFPENLHSGFFNKYNHAFETNQVVHFEEYYLALDTWYEVSAYPSSNGLSVYFKDVTERKLWAIRLQELNDSLQNYTQELVLSNKELEQFSYIVSHNLRAPVANIIGLADLLTKDAVKPTVKEECLNGLLINVKRLDEVIVDLNNILRVKKEVNEKKETVYMSLLVDSIQSSIQNLIQQEAVQVKVDFSIINEIRTVKSYLHSIFYNLISNSIKYRQPQLPPFIEIKSEIINDELIITFKDNGIGINLEKRKDQVFGLYKRFHPNIEGKGMGLFMVKTQVESLGGKISISSEVNKGTEFKIQFKNYT